MCSGVTGGPSFSQGLEASEFYELSRKKAFCSKLMDTGTKRHAECLRILIFKKKISNTSVIYLMLPFKFNPENMSREHIVAHCFILSDLHLSVRNE